jgi:hypothetical protein
MLLVPSAEVLWRSPEAARVADTMLEADHTAVIPCWRGTYGDEATARPVRAIAFKKKIVRNMRLKQPVLMQSAGCRVPEFLLVYWQT